MLPLSFKEFCGGLVGTEYGNLSRKEKFKQYIKYGSFPYIIRYELKGRKAWEYLQEVYNTVLLNDIVTRRKISDVGQLKSVTCFMLHNIGNKSSDAKIEKTMKSEGSSIDPETVDKFLEGLTESLLLYEAQRYNIKGKQFLTMQSKYYAVDMGLRNMLVHRKDSDIGYILENILCLELLRRGYEVFVGGRDDSEVDFVVKKDDQFEYYQVASGTLDENTLKREIAHFRKISDNYPKMLLTPDELFGTTDYEGIKKINVLYWLLDKKR